MKIKTRENTKRVSQELLLWFSKKRTSRWFLIILVSAFFVLLGATHIASIYYGATLQSEGKIHYIKRWGLTLSKKPFSIISNFIDSRSVSINKMQVDINFENYQKIAFQRELALKYGASYRVHPSNPGYVPAKISYKGKTSKIKMRLKGGQIEHYGHPHKWSFKVKMKGENKVNGMKYFSIQQAKNRGYLNEWVLHEFLRFNGLIALKYDFVELILNGKNYGIYAIEENMGKQLIEGNERKEGPILNYNTDLLWDSKGGQADFFSGGDIRAYNEGDIVKNPVLQNNFEIARNLLEGFRRSELRVDEVFDIEKLATYFAIIDLTGYQHATTLNNMKFYFNPITSFLEPIGYDNGNFIELKGKPLFGQSKIINFNRELDFKVEGIWESIWYQKLFSDPIFFKEYISALHRISDKSYLDSFFESMKTGFNEKRKIIQSEHPWYNHDGEFENPQTLYKNQEYIQSTLNPNILANGYFEEYSESENTLNFKVASIYKFPIEVIGFSIHDSLNFKSAPLKLQSFQNPQLNYEEIKLELPEEIVWDDSLKNHIKLNFSIFGKKDYQKSVKIIPWSPFDSNFKEKDLMRKNHNINDFDFIKKDELNKTISVLSGSWKIRKNLIIPRGYNFIIGKNTEIDLINQSKILSYSPVLLRGTEDYPIIIHSTDSTGQGIIVMKAEELSTIDYVFFENLTCPLQNTYSLTGAITFYESPVNISNTTFASNKIGDDYLNIVRTKFNIENSTFLNTHSDAFDGDFCEGTITNSMFINSGNDAIDVSGSDITITSVIIDKVGDKALSAGENSFMKVKDVKILKAELGVTSKDKSIVKIEDVLIESTKVGYVCFQKKPEFGRGEIYASKSKFIQVELPFLIEKGSIMNYNGKDISSDKENIKDILYGKEYGKKSQ